MRRFVSLGLVAAAIVTLIAAPTSAAPDGDSVVGTGTFEVFDISIDAHSDASGGNPSGTLSVRFTATGMVVVSGPVSCLEVTGNSAIVGVDGGTFGHFTIQVVDNSATGSPDTVSAPDFSDPVGCLFGGTIEFPLVSGDFVVHDAVPLTSKDQCKDGGWRDFTDDEGNAFDNQGECVAFLEQHAT
jgi:hypothetical protein